MSATSRQYLGFNDTWFWLIGIPVIGFAMPFLFFGHTIHDPLPELLANWAISFVMSIGYWLVSRMVIIYWRKRMSDPTTVVRRILFQVASILAFSFVFELLVKLTFESLIDAPNDPHPLSGMAGTYLIILLIVAIYEAVYLYSQWRKALIEQERVKQEHLRSQLEGLRNQVNPHFLFNSLNTLMSIVTEDQDLAVRYLQKLSSVFRHVLEYRNEQIIPLEDELSFMENYTFLQKERFRDNLVINIDIPEQARTHAIVPLSMQILFENAIKHNVISEKRPLMITVFVNEQNKLVIRNNLQLKDQETRSTKVGLDNIINRYQFFTNDTVEVEQTEDYFSVAIPLLPITKRVANELSHN